MSEILVVDDSLTVRMDLLEALDAAGLRSVGCGTLAEARAVLASRAIALAILDVRLPDGDGVAFLEELRTDPKFAELPIVMLSSEAEVKHRIRGLRTGASDYIGKPYDTAATIDRIRRLAGDGLTPCERPVVIIDDSPTCRASLGDVLVQAGYTVQTAASGPDGLRIAAAHPPAAIIVDGIMPDMDGAAVIRRVRLDPALRTTPCVLLTRADDPTAEIDALDAGADAFVDKESDLDLVLARLRAVLRAAHAEPAGSVSLLSPRRILVVDDSNAYRSALADQLRATGYDVAQASSGEEAIELLAVQHVDCILLDHTMPGRSSDLSGIATCERIKAAPVVRDIPLIMLSSVDSRDAIIEGVAAGADDFIAKSSGFDVLKARVQAQIRRRQFEDEHRRTREQLLRSEHEAATTRSARELAEARAQLVEQLELANRELAAANRELAAANRELEAFSSSVSHDLRAPLRSIDAFTRALAEDAGDRLAPTERAHLDRVLGATASMTELIDALLELSRIGRTPLRRSRADLSQIAGAGIAELRCREPAREVEAVVAPELWADADPKLVRIALDNLLGNAWKFTSHRPRARIEVGALGDPCGRVFFVRDNGAGFDAAQAGRLFTPFQRLHSDAEFSGTGIGLATVHRIVERHGGRMWAEGAVGRGAVFYFTLPSPAPGKIAG